MNDSNVLRVPLEEVKDLADGFNHHLEGTLFSRILNSMRVTKLTEENSMPVVLHIAIRSIHSNKVLVVYDNFFKGNNITKVVSEIVHDVENPLYLSIIYNIKNALKSTFKAGFELAMTTSTLQPVGMSLVYQKRPTMRRLVVHYVIYVEDKFANESYFETLEGTDCDCEFMDIKEAYSLENIYIYSDLIEPVMTLLAEEKGETRQ